MPSRRKLNIIFLKKYIDFSSINYTIFYIVFILNRLIVETTHLNRLSTGIAKSINLNPICYINKLHFSLLKQKFYNT